MLELGASANIAQPSPVNMPSLTQLLASHQRLLVLDADNRARGILSFGRILRNNGDVEEIAEVISAAVGREPGPVMDSTKSSERMSMTRH